jgi:hypothetical protein
LIDHNYAFDHVAKNGNEWAIAKRNCNYSAAIATTHRAIYTNNPRRAAKAWRKQPKTQCLTRN